MRTGAVHMNINSEYLMCLVYLCLQIWTTKPAVVAGHFHRKKREAKEKRIEETVVFEKDTKGWREKPSSISTVNKRVIAAAAIIKWKQDQHYIPGYNHWNSCCLPVNNRRPILFSRKERIRGAARILARPHSKRVSFSAVNCSSWKGRRQIDKLSDRPTPVGLLLLLYSVRPPA